MCWSYFGATLLAQKIIWASVVCSLFDYCFKSDRQTDPKKSIV
ncbi:MAG: hypothetical protein O4861_21425 [Trichodesmium sp. St16_bin4-tuft]|nr:hypothetical protein [Trichodesmium sp. St11_bin5]MDE5100751.1 hypothetical protein [Trichodesmium sp. St16_bin4-tuft]